MIDAALVIPVYRSRDGELRIVMILRQPGGVHGGQVAFPGGKRDPEMRPCWTPRFGKHGKSLGS